MQVSERESDGELIAGIPCGLCGSLIRLRMFSGFIGGFCLCDRCRSGWDADEAIEAEPGEGVLVRGDGDGT